MSRCVLIHSQLSVWLGLSQMDQSTEIAYQYTHGFGRKGRTLALQRRSFKRPTTDVTDKNLGLRSLRGKVRFCSHQQVFS